MIQGSPEWFAARCGCATASEFISIMAKGEGKTRSAYLRRVVAEMLTEQPCETFSNAHTERGNAQEPDARAEVEARFGIFIEQVGFIRHPELPIGCSPDGLVGTDGGVEIKSVIPTVQLETILAGGYPSKHKAQVQGNLWLTGRAWWDFCSYCPLMPTDELRLYVFRVERDEDYIAKLEKEVIAFVREAQQLRDLLLGNGLESALQASLAKVAA